MHNKLLLTMFPARHDDVAIRMRLGHFQAKTVALGRFQLCLQPLVICEGSALL